MPQVLKEDVRAQILKSALKIFSRNGFMKTRMNDIALESEVSTDNLYRYYQSKEEIFNQVFPADFPAQFLSLFRKRVKALGKSSDWALADASTDGSAIALLEFLTENRELSLILLNGSEGTPFADVRQSLVNELTKSATDFLKDNKNKKNHIEPDMFIVREIFANTISIMTTTLQNHEDPEMVRDSFNFFWRYHLAGLQALLNK